MRKKREISKEQMERQVNVIFMNKIGNDANEHSKMLSNHLFAVHPNLKAVTNLDIAEISNISVAAISSYADGKLLKVYDPYADANIKIPELITRLKFGTFITEFSEKLNDETMQLLTGETMIKKSLDLIMQHKGLLISPLEIKMLQQEIENAEKGKDIKRNISYVLFPNDKFEITKDYYSQIFKMYGEVNAIGLLISQLSANISNTVTYYNFFTKDIHNATSIEVEKAVTELLKKIDPNENVKEFIHKQWLKKEHVIETKTSDEISEKAEETNTEIKEEISEQAEEQTSELIPREQAMENANKELIETMSKFPEAEIMSRLPKMMESGEIGQIYFKHLQTCGYDKSKEEEEVTKFYTEAIPLVMQSIGI